LPWFNLNLRSYGQFFVLVLSLNLPNKDLDSRYPIGGFISSCFLYVCGCGGKTNSKCRWEYIEISSYLLFKSNQLK
jgi:hypothetical protein